MTGCGFENENPPSRSGGNYSDGNVPKTIVVEKHIAVESLEAKPREVWLPVRPRDAHYLIAEDEQGCNVVADGPFFVKPRYLFG